MESRSVRGGARVGPAAARSRGRDLATGQSDGTSKRYRGGRGDPGGPRADQRHLRRHWSPLPVLAGDAGHDQGSAQVTTFSVTIDGKAYGPREVRDELSMNDF